MQITSQFTLTGADVVFWPKLFITFFRFLCFGPFNIENRGQGMDTVGVLGVFKMSEVISKFFRCAAAPVDKPRNMRMAQVQCL